MPRDCHGDLHLDHVYYFPDQHPPADLVIIDCIEFNERFRFIDPVADMAFPTMDLAFLGRRDLAGTFADAYFRATGDEEGRALLTLYMAYRATVRGLVEGLKLAEKEVPPAEHGAALERARAHWLLALTELEEPGHKPCLLLVAGLPGTGKSTLGWGLAQSAGFSVVRSDVVRKELAGLPSQGQATPNIGEPLYTPQRNARTYAECLRRAEQLLFEGRRVLVDATFREQENRQTFLKAAVKWGVASAILVCQAEPETIRKRLANRQRDPSDADWLVYQQLAAGWEKIETPAGHAVYPISTDGTPEQALQQAMAVLRQSGLLE
jgi:predicted kinase